MCVKKNKTYQYCLDILGLGTKRKKALANLVMALGSQKAESVTALSESPVFRYEYSSISRAVKAISRGPAGLLSFERRVWGMLKGYLDVGQVVCLATDKTVVAKPHSPTLHSRTFVALPNPVFGGAKSLSVGYEYSWVNVQGEGSWSLPLSAHRIGADKTAAKVAGEQVLRLLSDDSLGLKQIELIINNLDSGYVGSGYLEEVKSVENLVSSLRLRHGTGIWCRAAPEEQKAGKVRKIFGQHYYLTEKSGNKHYKKHPKTGRPHDKFQTSILDKTPDEDFSWEDKLRSGEAVNVRVRSYRDMIFRAHNGVRMEDKPCKLVAVEVRDAQSGKLTYKKPMFLGFFGKKRDLCLAQQAPKTYALRYNIEPFFRFSKRNMLMDKYQTPDARNLDNWMYLVILASWLLYSARNDIFNRPKKWQAYGPANKGDMRPVKSLSEAQKSILPYLLTFDTAPFFPLKSKGGPGRQMGMCQPQRTKHPYVKKSTAKAKKPPKPPT